MKLSTIGWSVLLLFAVVPLAGCATNTNKPEVVWFFECSDLCPKPLEEYMVQVYDGVEDRNECLELGGIPGTLVGWGSNNYCKVAGRKTK